MAAIAELAAIADAVAPPWPPHPPYLQRNQNGFARTGGANMFQLR
jgi:hypothetical protein